MVRTNDDIVEAIEEDERASLIAALRERAEADVVADGA
jgi:hypothetical protein